MHEHAPGDSPRIVERHCDVAVIGGSAAGLAAALQLGRQRRGVIVIDSGEPRNAPAAHMHGYLGHEGLPPAELLELAREEVRSYGVEVLEGRVLDVQRRGSDTEPLGFELQLVGGHRVRARRVLVATGLVDELPDVEGLDALWGSDVIHCPFCHGYEVRDRRVVQILSHPIGLHPAALLARLTGALTIVVHDGVDADDPQLATLRGAGVEVIDAAAVSLRCDDDGALLGVELVDARMVDADAVAVVPRFRVRTESLGSLDVTTVAHPSGLGSVLEVDPTGLSSEPGLYAAGNVTDPGQQVLHAAAHGSRVGAMIAHDLAAEELVSSAASDTSDPTAPDAPAAPGSAALPANQVDWEHRYGGEQMWSGNPNGSLVAEATAMQPARALDVGAGEGGDAIWLAEQGWQVTANDISARALGRIEAEAARRGLALETLRADLNALDPFGSRCFELVCAQYASVPRTRDGRGIANLLSAVAPGGSLVVVSHDLEPMRAPVDTTRHSRAFDPDAYVRVQDVVAAIDGSPEWTIEAHERRPRPAGAVSTHHVDDVVLRARRAQPD